MNIELLAFAQLYPLGATATHPLARLAVRLPLSFLVAGPGLPPPHFAATTHPDAPSGASN
jgi:hypothetical protein